MSATWSVRQSTRPFAKGAYITNTACTPRRRANNHHRRHFAYTSARVAASPQGELQSAFACARLFSSLTYKRSRARPHRNWFNQVDGERFRCRWCSDRCLSVCLPTAASLLALHVCMPVYCCLASMCDVCLCDANMWPHMFCVWCGCWQWWRRIQNYKRGGCW